MSGRGDAGPFFAPAAKFSARVLGRPNAGNTTCSIAEITAVHRPKARKKILVPKISRRALGEATGLKIFAFTIPVVALRAKFFRAVLAGRSKFFRPVWWAKSGLKFAFHHPNRGAINKIFQGDVVGIFKIFQPVSRAKGPEKSRGIASTSTRHQKKFFDFAGVEVTVSTCTFTACDCPSGKVGGVTVTVVLVLTSAGASRPAASWAGRGAASFAVGG